MNDTPLIRTGRLTFMACAIAKGRTVRFPLIPRCRFAELSAELLTGPMQADACRARADLEDRCGIPDRELVDRDHLQQDAVLLREAAERLVEPPTLFFHVDSFEEIRDVPVVKQ
jgi:hypothetical protein